MRIPIILSRQARDHKYSVGHSSGAGQEEGWSLKLDKTLHWPRLRLRKDHGYYKFN